MAAATRPSRIRSAVKYGTRSRGIAGSPPSMTTRPPRLADGTPPSDISTARTRAWSPPVRVLHQLRGAAGVRPPLLVELRDAALDAGARRRGAAPGGGPAGPVRGQPGPAALVLRPGRLLLPGAGDVLPGGAHRPGGPG